MQRPDQPHATPRSTTAARRDSSRWRDRSARQRNQFTAGAAYDRSSVGFAQSTELGYLNPDRSVTGVGAFGDGVTGGDVDGEPFDTRVDLDGRIHTWSVYATDTLSIGDAWHLTLSGRFNRTTVDNRDRIEPGGGPGSLDGDHVFGRFNPAAGVTFSPSRVASTSTPATARAAARRRRSSSAAPTPTQPCKLPNAMAGDPPLDQVVTRTFEAGVRGGAAAASAGTPACSAPRTATTSCSSRRSRPASATSRTSARRGGRGSSSA